MLETPAYVLFSRPKGETSLWLSVFTPYHGRLQLTYKGGYRKRLTCQPFQLLDMTWNQGKHGQSWCLGFDHRLFEVSLTGMANWSGLYVNELLHHGLAAESPAPKLFNDYQKLLKGLRLAQDDRAHMAWCLRRFEWQLLAALGYAFPDDDCDHHPIQADMTYQWHENIGWMQDKDGISGKEILQISQNDAVFVQSFGNNIKQCIQQRIMHRLPNQAMLMRQWWEKPI